MKELSLLIVATLCVNALSPVVVVGPTYAAAGDIYSLGTLGGASSAGYGINDAGQVIGSAQDAAGRSRAFLWDSSQGMTDLGTANGYTEARAYAINAAGSVVGVESDNATGVAHAFAWKPNVANGTTGAITNLAVQDYSTAADINAAGLIVGSSTHTYFVDDGSCTPDNPYYPNCGPGGTWESETRAVLWENGVGADLTSPGFTLETANAINNAAQVTGQTAAAHAFRYDGAPGSGGIMYDLGTLGGTTSVGNAINDAGQVVGDSYITGDAAQHAFRYSGTPGSGGVMVDLGTVGGTSSHAYDVNETGFVVGVADRAAGAGGGSWATLWQIDAGNTAIDLDAWFDAINPTLGVHWSLTEARGINNNGLITGVGMYDDGPGGLTDGSRAFVLDASSLIHPIPGDFNNNGTVDAADYIVWRDNLGSGTALPNDDTAGVGPDDYDRWKMHFGEMAGTGSVAGANAAVPEPATLVTLILATAGWCLRRPRAA